MQQSSVAMLEVVDHKSIDNKRYHVEDRRPEYRDRPPHRHFEQQSFHCSAPSVPVSVKTNITAGAASTGISFSSGYRLATLSWLISRLTGVGHFCPDSQAVYL